MLRTDAAIVHAQTENVRGITHVHKCRKDDIFRQRRLNHSEVGGRNIAFRRVYPARAYTTLVVLVIMGISSITSFGAPFINYIRFMKICQV